MSQAQQYPGARGGSFDLGEYRELLWLRKWSILAIAAVVVAAALGITYQQTPIYDSSASVLVLSVSSPLSSSPTDSTLNMENEALLAASTDVAELAAQDPDIDHSGDPDELLGGLAVVPQGTAEVLDFSYSSSDPDQAQARAQGFAEAYLQYRLERIKAALAPLEQQIQDERATLQDLNKQLSDNSTDPELQTKVSSQTALVTSLEQQLAQTIPSASLTPESVGNIVHPAFRPGAPSSPKPIRSAALALAIGLALGVGLAFLRDRLDDRLRDRGDLEAHAGTRVLAAVPRVTTWRTKGRPYLVTREEPHSVAAEAFRTLRTAVLFAASQRNHKVVLLTSANLGEGKTSTTANLGVALAQAGKRVILVSADLRRPRLNDFFGITSATGLTSVLSGETELWNALIQPGIANLRILPSGPVPDNPTELLGSDAMGKLLAELRDVADFVLVDAAPTLPVADSMTLAPLTDAVLLIADASRTSRKTIQRAMDQLAQVDAQILGAVLNKFDPRQTPGYAAEQDGYAPTSRPVPTVAPRIVSAGKRGSSSGSG